MSKTLKILVVSLVVFSAVVMTSPFGSVSTAAPAVGPITLNSINLNDGLQATQVAAGARVSCALSNGSVYCWGTGFYGSLGIGVSGPGLSYDYPVKVVNGADGFTNTGVTAIDANGANVCAVQGGSVYCWGANDFGQLGNDTTTNSNTPVKVLNGTSGFENSDITAISVGDSFVCAVRDTNGATDAGHKLYCWGLNNNDQLGQASTDFSCTFNGSPQRCEKLPVLVTPQADLPNNGSEVISDVAASSGFACAITGGEVVCWGVNNSGVLGRTGLSGSTFYAATNVATNGTFANSGVTAIAVDRYNACAIEDGEVFCWGSNESGALGNGSDLVSSQDFEALPQKVADNSTVGFTNSGVTAVVIGGGYGGPAACVVASGSVYCWGNDGVDSIGTSILGVAGPDMCGSDECAKKPVKVSDGEMVNTGLAAGAGALAMSNEHVCAIKSSTVFCWGSSGEGQLGLAGGWADPNANPPTYYQNPWMVYNTAPPTVTSFSPTTFGRGDTITLSGTNLRSMTKVWVGGFSYATAQNECAVSSASDTSLTCTFGSTLTTNSSIQVLNLRSLTAFTDNPSNPVNPPTFTWTGGIPVPVVVLGQCAGGTLGVKMEDLPAGNLNLFIDVVGGVMGPPGLLPVMPSEIANGTLSKAFSQMLVMDMQNPMAAPTATPLAYGVDYLVSGVIHTASGSLPLAGVNITLVDGGSTSSCPVTGAATGGAADSSTGDSTGGAADSSTGDSTGGAEPPRSTIPTLVTAENQQLLTAPAGTAKILIDGELVEVNMVQASEDLRRSAPEARTAAQVGALQALATEMLAAVRAAVGADVTLPITITNTANGATITGLVTDPVTGEPMAVPIEDVLLIVSDKLALMVGGADGANDPANIALDGVIEFGQGGFIAVLAYGLTPGQTGEVVVMSTPQLLKTFEVADDGGVAAQSQIPAGIAAGDHTVVVTVGDQAASLGFRVLTPGVLPVAGNRTVPSSWAVLMLAAGGLAVLTGTRRRDLVRTNVRALTGGGRRLP